MSLPETMKRAMAAQAEAEREKRAKIINAEGEFQAAERLTQAAAMMSREPGALQLRYLQSMREIASERSSMTILPIPIESFRRSSRWRNAPMRITSRKPTRGHPFPLLPPLRLITPCPPTPRPPRCLPPTA